VLYKFGFGFGVVWVALRLVGGFSVSLFCIRQTDLKSLIAYSSVAHMSMVIGCIITPYRISICGLFGLTIFFHIIS
jgi:NADH-ubiquinone oxidoreductase chain 4